MDRTIATNIYNEHIKPNYSMQPGGGIRRIRVRKELPDRILELYGVFSPVIGTHVTLDRFSQSLMNLLQEDSEAPSEDQGCTSLDSALDEFMEDFGLGVQYDQIRYTESGRLASPDTVRAIIASWCWGKNHKLSKGDTLYPKVELVEHFRATQENLSQKRWKTIMRELTHRKHSTGLKGAILSILEAIGCPEDRRDLDSIMLAHWMWCIKRKFISNDYRPSLPLMIVLAGVQGTGKSSFVEKWLTQPFSDKVINTTLDVLQDKREIEKFTNSLVINFDELTTKDKKAEIPELLKNMITLGHVQSRVMGATSQQKMEILSSFTATTNRHLSEVIRDETGARRYWVLETSAVKHGQFDWDALQRVNWRELWQGVDENKVGGYLSPDSSMFRRIHEVQNTYCISPIVKAWFEENYIVPPEEWKHVWELTKLEMDKMPREDKPVGLLAILPGSLYEFYADDMKARDLYSCAPLAFDRMLEKMGVRTVRQSKRYNTPYYVLLKKSELDKEEAAE